MQLYGGWSYIRPWRNARDWSTWDTCIANKLKKWRSNPTFNPNLTPTVTLTFTLAITRNNGLTIAPLKVKASRVLQNCKVSLELAWPTNILSASGHDHWYQHKSIYWAYEMQMQILNRKLLIKLHDEKQEISDRRAYPTFRVALKLSVKSTRLQGLHASRCFCCIYCTHPYFLIRK